MPKTPDMDVAHPQLQFKKKKSGTKVMTSQAQNNRPKWHLGRRWVSESNLRLTARPNAAVENKFAHVVAQGQVYLQRTRRRDPSGVGSALGVLGVGSREVREKRSEGVFRSKQGTALFCAVYRPAGAGWKLQGYYYKAQGEYE